MGPYRRGPNASRAEPDHVPLPVQSAEVVVYHRAVDRARVDRLRREAREQGLRILKSRVRDPQKYGYNIWYIMELDGSTPGFPEGLAFENLEWLILSGEWANGK